MDLADEIDDTDVQKRRKVTFTGKQLLAFDGNRFSKDDMTESINLYLRSTGGAQECEKAVHNVFTALNDG